MTVDTARLRRLLEGASKGTWGIIPGSERTYPILCNDEGPLLQIEATDHGEIEELEWLSEANLALIVAMHEALPKLLEMAERLERLEKPDELSATWRKVGAKATWNGSSLGIEIGDLRKDWPTRDLGAPGSSVEATE